MNVRAFIAALNAALFAILLAVSPAWSGSTTLLGVGKVAAGGGFTPSCTSSTNFLARTSGMTTPQKTSYDTLICGLETDGVGCSNTLDALYILAAPTSTIALLNLCSASFALTVNGTVTFTANQGYTGGGAATDYIDTGFVASTASGFYTQDSASIGSCVLTTDANFTASIGASTPESFIIPDGFGTNTYGNINGAGPSPANTSAIADWLVTRTGPTASVLYKNGVSFATDTVASTGISSTSFYILAENNGGPAFRNGTYKIASAVIGKGLTPTQAGNVHNRISTFVTAAGNTGC